jgi:hypothetical protein
MADPFGIIGVVGVAVQLTQISVQFEPYWIHAPDDVPGDPISLPDKSLRFPSEEYTMERSGGREDMVNGHRHNHRQHRT